VLVVECECEYVVVVVVAVVGGALVVVYACGADVVGHPAVVVEWPGVGVAALVVLGSGVGRGGGGGGGGLLGGPKGVATAIPPRAERARMVLKNFIVTSVCFCP
jgi:hypothetical protein